MTTGGRSRNAPDISRPLGHAGRQDAALAVGRVGRCPEGAAAAAEVGAFPWPRPVRCNHVSSRGDQVASAGRNRPRRRSNPVRPHSEIGAVNHVVAEQSGPTRPATSPGDRSRQVSARSVHARSARSRPAPSFKGHALARPRHGRDQHRGPQARRTGSPAIYHIAGAPLQQSHPGQRQDGASAQVSSPVMADAIRSS